ncbi:hypothetical protein [Planotetraspora silvatica]|uniref:hypothetical protein n=1 Tax=Planotetraspora silvatica TaxID=234614 RepID=UPI0031E45F70
MDDLLDRVDPRPEPADHLTVDRDPAVADHLLAGPAAGDAGLGEDLLQPLAARHLCGVALVDVVPVVEVRVAQRLPGRLERVVAGLPRPAAAGSSCRGATPCSVRLGLGPAPAARRTGASTQLTARAVPAETASGATAPGAAGPACALTASTVTADRLNLVRPVVLTAKPGAGATAVGAESRPSLCGGTAVVTPVTTPVTLITPVASAVPVVRAGVVATGGVAALVAAAVGSAIRRARTTAEAAVIASAIGPTRTTPETTVIASAIGPTRTTPETTVRRARPTTETAVGGGRSTAEATVIAPTLRPTRTTPETTIGRTGTAAETTGRPRPTAETAVGGGRPAAEATVIAPTLRPTRTTPETTIGRARPPAETTGRPRPTAETAVVTPATPVVLAALAAVRAGVIRPAVPAARTAAVCSEGVVVAAPEAVPVPARPAVRAGTAPVA